MPDSSNSPISQPEEERKSPEMLEAERQLREARGTSAEIAEKVERLLLIRKKMEAHLGALDLAWERRKFFEQNMDAYFAWAAGEGRLPSSKQLDSIVNDYELIGLALKHVEFRLKVLDTAGKMSLSEELGAKSRILRLRSQEQLFRAGRALNSVREEIGPPEGVIIIGGLSQRLEERADQLTEQSAALRHDAERLTKLLQQEEKGQKEAQHA